VPQDPRLSAFFLFAVPFLLFRTRVEIGDDGIALRWFGRRTFVPASSIRHFRRTREGRRGAVIEVEHTDGPPIVLVLGVWPLRRRELDEYFAENVLTAESRLRDIVGGRSAPIETLRAFEAASTPDLHALRALADRVATFRDTPTTKDDLRDIAESEDAP